MYIYFCAYIYGWFVVYIYTIFMMYMHTDLEPLEEQVPGGAVEDEAGPAC